LSYEAGIAEPWRDPAHEEEIAGAGKILQDFRREKVSPG